MEQDTRNIADGLNFLKEIIQIQLGQNFNKKKWFQKKSELQGLRLKNDQDPLANLISFYQLSTEESIVLLMALVPHVVPHFFDALIAEVLPKGGEFPEFGGVKGTNHRGMIPTGETVLFILAGNDLEKRFKIQQLFSSEHLFAKNKILYLEEVKLGEPFLSGKLILDQDYIDLFTQGFISVPKLSSTFPAQYISTDQEWEDLVLNSATLNEILEIENWLKHKNVLLYEWGMQKSIKPGYNALFYGPPGTGKTMTAKLLGKYTQKPVFRIDLSRVVSKFIGETEKNLANLFDKAQNKDWILFFDEADAVFGKRTGVRDAHDKYANQEVSYLLQRIEDYQGLTILASNFKKNIDDAFLRRFNSIIYFPVPSKEDRLGMWHKAFPKQVELSPEIDLEKIAQKYELTGAHIMNTVHYSCLQALSKESKVIQHGDLMAGIKKEFMKEGKSI